MKKRQKEAILVTFLKEKQKYEQLAEYMFHLIRDDPSSPKESLHTIKYRIKNEARLLEKIDEHNKQAGPETAPITKHDFQERIGDLLGIRLICLRLSDIRKVEAYLGFLADEKILRFIDKPDQKRSFVLPVDPGEAIPAGLDLGYSGYSSIHYHVKLGDHSDAVDELKDLQIEIQLRTILEEAWGEIDHKYRYMLSRSGNELPEYIHTGFYNLSAYLQAAALQAEHLCRQAETYRRPMTRRARGKPATRFASGPGPGETVMDDTDPENSLISLRGAVEKVLGFEPPVRTLTYILKRIDGLSRTEKPQVVFRRIISKSRLQEFRTVFHEVLGREAFQDKRKRNVDAINVVNYAIFDEMHGNTVAREGLRSVLRWRRQDSLRREESGSQPNRGSVG